MKCPKCHQAERQVKDGLTTAGSQRFRCQHCGYRYTPQPKERGHDEQTRLLAKQMYLEGMSQRAIGRVLGISPQSVGNWVHDHVSQLPTPPLPEDVDVAELDEMFTFIGDKKTDITS